MTRSTQGVARIEKPFEAYRGQDPFVFVCYAHRDASEVYPEITWLREQGTNIWYDEGISAGRNWRAEIGIAISSARKVIFYVSRASLDSDHCSREINFALDEGKEIIPIYLEDVALTTDLKLGLGRVQALYRFEDQRYRQHLLSAIRADSTDMQAPAAAPTYKQRRNPHLLWLVCAALLLCGLALFVFIGPRPDQPPPALPRETSTQLVSLAIAPFARTSADIPGLEYEIERRLSASAGLVVRVEPSASDSRDYYLTGTELGNSLRLELLDRNGVSIADWTVGLDGNLSSVANVIGRKILAKIGRSGEVLSQFENAIDPGLFRTYLSATAMLRSSHTRETLDSARQSFAAVLESEPRYAPAHAGLCNTYLIMYTESRRQDLFSSAEQHCHRALTLDEQSPDVHAALGRLYRETGQIPKAIDSYHRALSIAPYSTDAMRGLAETYDQSGAGKEAESWFHKAIAVEPNHWENYQALGIHEFMNGHFDRAIESFQTAHALAPNETAISNNIGAGYFMLEDFEQAVKYWQLVANQQPSPQIYANLAASYFYQRDFDQAYAMYERAHDLVPNDHAFVGHMGEALYVTDPAPAAIHLNNAIGLAEAQLRIDPIDPITLSSLASYHAGLGHGDEALDFLRRALAHGSEDIDVQYNAAVCYTRLGQMELARETLGTLRKLGFSESILARDANFDDLY